jgi:hypothetical protein
MTQNMDTATNTTLLKKGKGFVRSSVLILQALASAFFPRVLTFLKFPSAINFLHFFMIPLAFGVVLTKARPKDREQIALAHQLLTALGILLTISFASALLNDVGIINVVLSYLLWTEPFLLLIAIVFVPMHLLTLEGFRKWIMGFSFANLLLALAQKYVLHWDTCGCSPGGFVDGDAIKGVFIAQGSGHVVGSSVSASFAAYYLSGKNRPLWTKILVVFLTFLHIIISDTKQVLLVVILSIVILYLANVKDIGKTILIFAGMVIFGFAFLWACENIDFMGAYLTWARPELFEPDGEGAKVKFAGIRVILSYLHSPLHSLLGLGSGHTIDRLGGWMLKDYSDLLSPIGATQTLVSEKTWAIMEASWLAESSSFFSPFWGWAALWGDIGFLGLGAYLYLCSITWGRLCPGELPKFLMLNVFVNGLIFTQMQEPGYMLHVASLIGLYWQEHKHGTIMYENQQF